MSPYGRYRRHALSLLPEGVAAARVRLDPPRDPAHGDMATNAALIARLPPADLAARFAELPDVEAATVGGAGFINLRLHPVVWRDALWSLLEGEAVSKGCVASPGIAIKEWAYSDPVFAMQYGHARCWSVIRHAATLFGPVEIARTHLEPLADAADLALVRRLARWPDVRDGDDMDRVRCYLADLAAAFHAYWRMDRGGAEVRMMAPADRALSLARLALVRGVATVLASGLAVLGMDPVEEMR